MRSYRKWLVQRINKHCYSTGAEIGVRRGDTTACILQHCSVDKMYAVEPFCHLPDSPGGERYKGNAFSRMEAKFRSKCEADLKTGRCELLKTPSIQAAQYIPDGSLDFVFIDGDHSYEGVRQDILAWYPKVRTGGELYGHDVSLPGVQKAVAELLPFYRARPDEDIWFLEQMGARDAYNSFVLPERKLVFNLNLKCGATTIKRMIQHQLNSTAQTGDARDGLVYINNDQISQLPDDYTVVSIVRDPADRLVSCYYDKFLKPRFQIACRMALIDENKVNRSAAHDEAARESIRAFRRYMKTMAFAQCVDAVYNLPVELHDPHFQAQHHTLYPRPDYRIPLKNLQDHWPELADRFNLPKLQKRNATNRSSSDSILKEQNNETIRRIHEIYQRDYELLSDFYKPPELKA